MEERRKAAKERVLKPGEAPTNYPGHSSFMHRIDEHDERYVAQHRLLTSILMNEPSVAFDFRFVSQHTRVERIKSLYRQFIEIIWINRISARPFQLHFCNYDHSSEFNTRFNNWLALDKNLIMETTKSYTDVFDKSKLVYLSADANKKMTSFNPDNVYVIGAMIDMSPNEFELYSYAQAKKDGIRCERLPLDLKSFK